MSTMSASTLREPEPGALLAARADLCRLLAACYYEPGPEFAEEGVFDSLASAGSEVDAALGILARRMGPSFSAAAGDDLLVDHARLFMGPNAPLARPYAASWLSDPEARADLLALYASGGFEVAESFAELPDHVAAELEFLYLLLFSEARARGLGELSEAASLAAIRRQFLDRHLARWIGPFTEAVENAAHTDFHRNLAALTRSFVAHESRLA